MKYNHKSYLWVVAVLGIAVSAAAIGAPEEDVIVKPNAVSPDVKIGRGFTGEYLSGQFAKSSGDITGAIRHLRNVHKKAPGDVGVASQLEGLLLLDGKIDEAIAVAEDIRKADSQDPVAILLLTLKELKNNNVEKAGEVLEAAFETDGGQLWLPLVTAWLDLGRGELTKPLQVEELSANVGRAAPIVNYHLALANAQAGFTEAAALNFKNAIEDVKNPPVRIMAALLQFYDRNNSPPALKPLVEDYRKTHPNINLVEEAPVITTPQDGVAEVLFTMGNIMLGAGVTQDAVVYLQLALYLQPKFTAAALTLGDAYSELRQYARANQIYAKIGSGGIAQAKAQLRMAINYNQMGKLSEALSFLDKMSPASSPVPDVLVAKGDLLRIHARYGEAVTAYTQALDHISDLKPFHWPVLFSRGTSFERMGKWDAAERDLKQALSLKPNQPEVLNYLGYSWLTRGEHLEEARAMIETAVKARPNDAQIVDSMGWALYLLGQYDQAIEYLEKAVELVPSDPTVNDHLGDVYWRAGRKTEARFQWERSLTYSPEPALAESLHKKLKEGLPPSGVATNSPLKQAMTQDSTDKAAITE